MTVTFNQGPCLKFVSADLRTLRLDGEKCQYKTFGSLCYGLNISVMFSILMYMNFFQLSKSQHFSVVAVAVGAVAIYA